jgi:magnesium transporter
MSTESPRSKNLNTSSSTPVPQLTNPRGRPRLQDRADRSKNTSLSRATSPANSVEAFADPRRRERANTLESRPRSLIEAFNRRPSITSGPGRASVSNAGCAGNDIGFPTYDEPGKTYKVDYEELEEFVALSAQGLIPDLPPSGRKLGVAGDGSAPKVFYDLRQGSRKYDVPQIVMKDRFTLFSSATESVTYGAELGDFVSDGITTFRDLLELGPDGGVWWLDVTNPTSAELECLSKAFKLHPLTKEDIEQQEAREKVELFSQYYFVCFRSFHSDVTSEDFLQAVNVYIVVCDEGILSFSFSDTPHTANVRKRINKSRDFVNLGSDYICYALM